jgi:hypothetical protein
VGEQANATASNLPLATLRREERKLNPDEKRSHEFFLSKEGTDTRLKQIQHINRKGLANGCSVNTIHTLGPFATSDLQSYIINGLGIHPSDIKDVHIRHLCEAMNRAIKSYQRAEPNMGISLETFLKRNLTYYIIQQIMRQQIQKFKDDEIEMEEEGSPDQ